MIVLLLSQAHKVERIREYFTNILPKSLFQGGDRVEFYWFGLSPAAMDTCCPYVGQNGQE